MVVNLLVDVTYGVINPRIRQAHDLTWPPRPSRSTRRAPAPPRGPLREFWGYFSANHGAVAGLVIVIAVLLMAAFANVLAPYPPDLTNNAVFLKPPAWQAGGSWAYPLGTDAIGRDILSRLIYRRAPVAADRHRGGRAVDRRRHRARPRRRLLPRHRPRSRSCG